MTKIAESVDEWALLNGTNKSVTNCYQLDLTSMEVIDLDDHGPLAWIAEVISHRGVSTQIGTEFMGSIIEKYKVDTSRADVVE